MRSVPTALCSSSLAAGEVNGMTPSVCWVGAVSCCRVMLPTHLGLVCHVVCWLVGQ